VPNAIQFLCGMLKRTKLPLYWATAHALALIACNSEAACHEVVQRVGTAAARALAVIGDKAALRQQLLDAGAVRPLLALLATPQASRGDEGIEDLHMAAVAALAALSYQGCPAKHSIVAFGGLPLLVELLQRPESLALEGAVEAVNQLARVVAHGGMPCRPARSPPPGARPCAPQRAAPEQGWPWRSAAQARRSCCNPRPGPRLGPPSPPRPAYLGLG
jgi:hypothetical protein